MLGAIGVVAALAAQREAAERFVSTAQSEVIDRLLADDANGARQRLPAVQVLYQARRAGVDEAVKESNQVAAGSLAALADT